MTFGVVPVEGGVGPLSPHADPGRSALSRGLGCELPGTPPGPPLWAHPTPPGILNPFLLFPQPANAGRPRAWSPHLPPPVRPPDRPSWVGSLEPSAGAPRRAEVPQGSVAPSTPPVKAKLPASPQTLLSPQPSILGPPCCSSLAPNPGHATALLRGLRSPQFGSNPTRFHGSGPTASP